MARVMRSEFGASDEAEALSKEMYPLSLSISIKVYYILYNQYIHCYN